MEETGISDVTLYHWRKQASYKIPAIGDMPTEFNVELLPDSPKMEATIFHSKARDHQPYYIFVVKRSGPD